MPMLSTIHLDCLTVFITPRFPFFLEHINTQHKLSKWYMNSLDSTRSPNRSSSDWTQPAKTVVSLLQRAVLRGRFFFWIIRRHRGDSSFRESRRSICPPNDEQTIGWGAYSDWRLTKLFYYERALFKLLELAKHERGSTTCNSQKRCRRIVHDLLDGGYLTVQSSSISAT